MKTIQPTRKKGENMFCSQCGKELPNDAKFCDSCGKALQLSTEKAPVSVCK